MASQKCVADTESANDALRVIVDKAMGFPSKGVHVGGGRHCNMPDTWDGSGPTPPGWTKTANPVFVLNAATTWLPIDDSLAALLQQAGPQGKLTGPEKATLAQAIAGRVTADPEGSGATPKNSAKATAEGTSK